MTEAAGSLRAAQPIGGHPRARRAWSVAVTVLAVTASVLSSLTYYAADSAIPGTDELAFTARATAGLIAALGAAAALVWRHRHPVLVTGIAIVPPLIFVADALAALIALAALAASRRDRVLWIGAGLVFAATASTTRRDARRDPENSLVQAMFSPETADQVDVPQVDVPQVAVLLIAAVLTAVPIAIGLLRGARRDLARREHTERKLLADLARQDERSRIAREMHDILGHRLSLLSLQAGALEVSNDDSSTSAADAARTIRATARQCLDDLRQVIGVLRDGHSWPHPDDEEDGPTRPQPTLADLPDLITATRRSGLAINVTVVLEEASMAPAALGTAAYRIVQEALTNVLRHAPGTTADVTVRGGPEVGLTVEVVNPLPDGVAVPAAGSGTGLVGITERVSTLGGTVSTGPTDQHTFTVTAWLPWPRVS